MVAVAQEGEKPRAQVAPSFAISESGLARWLQIADRDDGTRRAHQQRRTGVLRRRGHSSRRFTDRGLRKRIELHTVPTLSSVPDARAPPNGCSPTTAPVGLSLTVKFPAV